MNMLIGNCAIANRFIDYSLQSKYLIYIGEVNNSTIIDKQHIENEEIQIKKALDKYPDKIFVYFSTCSILDQEAHETPYVQHKVRMEQLIEESSQKYFIFRLPQVIAASDTESGLIDYLIEKIYSQEHFELWTKAKRNVIDIDDVYEIVHKILQRSIALNKIINIANPYQISVEELVDSIEQFIGIKSRYTKIEKGSSYDIDISEIRPILDECEINFDTEYFNRLLTKYYGQYKLPAPQPRKILSIIVPTYNEENGIEEFYRRTKSVLEKLSVRFDHELIFVNDYSTDNTFSRLLELAKLDKKVKLINFSRNFGNQIAITAGIDYASGDIAVIIDDDLQDPPEIIINLIAKWDKGYKVVYGVRPVRRGGSKLFKLVAKIFYRIIGNLSETNIPKDTGDFRLIDRIVMNTLKEMKEENRYYRGMVSWVGFSQTGVIYERDKRYAGESTFSFKKYVNFAVNGLTSFTEKPLYFSSLAGGMITLTSFIFAIALIGNKLFDPSFSIQGWTSMMVIILFFGGIQLLSIGILGVYISKIYREVKGRPLYIVEEMINI